MLYLAAHFFDGAQFLVRNAFQAQILFILAQIFRMLVLYCLVIILEFYSQNLLFTGKQTILAILVFFTIGGMLSTPNLEAELFETIYIISFEHLSPVVIVQMIFNIYASIWLIILLRRNLKSASIEKQKKVVKYLLIGIFLAIFLPLLPNLTRTLTGGRSPRGNLLFGLVFGSILQNIGILIVGLIFYRISNNPWLLQQQKVYLLICYSHDGVELYSKSFSEDITSESLMLLAGGFSAISSMFKEITDAEGIITAILLEDKELRIIKKEHFISAMLVDYSTEATEQAHESFADEFENEYRGELKDWGGEVSKFKKANKITAKYFFSVS